MREAGAQPASSAPPTNVAAGPLRGDSLGPLPALSKLTIERANEWLRSWPIDHFVIVDIPKGHRYVASLSEWQARARHRQENLRTWADSHNAELQTIAAASDERTRDLAAAVADDAALQRYITGYSEGVVRASAQRYFEDDHSIDADEYRMVLRDATNWQVSEARALAIVREVDPNFTPPKPEPPKAKARGGAWTALVGRFRSAPSSLEELHEAMVAEIPVAQDLLSGGLLSFHLSQQKESKLAQAADRVVGAYDRRESLMVWDFLWSTGYPNLHVIGLPPVDTLDRLVRACDGRSAPLVDAIRSGQLALWAERVADSKDLARVARPDKNLDPREQARRALWLAGDKRLQLATGEVVGSLPELEAVMLKSSATAQAAVREAASGALFEWMRAVGEGGLAKALADLGRGKSELYSQYMIIWASGRIRSLPLWASSGPAVMIEIPTRLGDLDRRWLQIAWTLLEADVLGLWTSALKIPTLATTWASVLNSYRGRAEALRIEALRWSVGAGGILSSSGVLRTAEELFALFERTPAEVVSMYHDGILEEWARASLRSSPRMAEVASLPPVLRPLGALWCIGYPSLHVGTVRVDDLQSLAALPDSAHPALEACIASGALAFWRNVRFPDSAPVLAGPVDVETALLAAGAAPAQLNVSAPRIDFGEILESEKRVERLVFVASGERGRVSAVLRSLHPGVSLSLGGTTHRYGETPLTIGPLWASSQGRTEVSVEVTALPTVSGDGAIEVVASNGIPPVTLPVQWVTRFPSGALLLQSLLGFVGGGAVALAFRSAAGLLLNDVLYVRPNTNFTDTSVPMRAIPFENMSDGAIAGIGILPGLIGATILTSAVYQNRNKVDPNTAAGLAFLTFLIGFMCLVAIVGRMILFGFAGIDMVGHRLRAVFGSTMPLLSSALLGWVFTLSLVGAAMFASRVLQTQERPTVARLVLAAPLLLILLLLLT